MQSIFYVHGNIVSYVDLTVDMAVVIYITMDPLHLGLFDQKFAILD